MCKYCEESNDLSVSLGMKIECNQLIVKHEVAGSIMSEDITINYCPMCGEKLVNHYKNKQK